MPFASIPKKRVASYDGFCHNHDCRMPFKAGDEIVWGNPTVETKQPQGAIGPFCSRECHDTVEHELDESL